MTGIKIHGHGIKMEDQCMYKYEKKLAFPVNVTKTDLRMAKYIITGLGGAAGELGAALRYFSQSFSMPDDHGKALLTDIATEEFGHCEMIATMFRQLIKDANLKDLESAGLGAYYTEHGKGIYPIDPLGYQFTASYFASTGNTLADLAEDMAAEEKARAGYENLLDLATDEALIGPLLFLRQREIIHYNRFKELYDEYKKSQK
jgi:spore coat protein JC